MESVCLRELPVPQCAANAQSIGVPSFVVVSRSSVIKSDVLSTPEEAVSKDGSGTSVGQEDGASNDVSFLGKGRK